MFIFQQLWGLEELAQQPLAVIYQPHVPLPMLSVMVTRIKLVSARLDTTNLGQMHAVYVRYFYSFLADTTVQLHNIYYYLDQLVVRLFT